MSVAAEEPGGPAGYTAARRACSSGDRARASGARGRRFDSCQAQSGKRRFRPLRGFRLVEPVWATEQSQSPRPGLTFRPSRGSGDGIQPASDGCLWVGRARCVRTRSSRTDRCSGRRTRGGYPDSSRSVRLAARKDQLAAKPAHPTSGESPPPTPRNGRSLLPAEASTHRDLSGSWHSPRPAAPDRSQRERSRAP